MRFDFSTVQFTMNNVLYGLVLLFTSVRQNQAFFGLTSETVLPDLVYSFQPNGTQKFRDAVLLAERKLPRVHKRERSLAETLADAVLLSSLECARQFEYERWNCSLNSVRLNLLKEAYPETAFLYSITSASLVHTMARACSSGKLRHCTCDEHSFNASENRKTWLWGGCGDNVKFGTRFARKFLLESGRRAKDLRALVEWHNSEVGIKVVRRKVTKVCKCHGVSGSCTVRTCWKELSPFSRIGSILKRKYTRAMKPNICNESGLGRKRKNRKGRFKTSRKKGRNKNQIYRRLGILDRSTLLYLDESPNFCNPTEPWPDTRGRRCHRGIDCNNLCCGRGYNSRILISNVSCKCRVIWCCTVNCESCRQRREIYTCK